MESTPAGSAAHASEPLESALTPWARAVAVFVRPAQAWGGLAARAQFWFPLLLMILVSVAFSLALYDRAILPMIVEQWQQAVDNGQMGAEDMERAMGMTQTPVMRTITTVQQPVMWVVFTLLWALGVWFGVGFVLGSKLNFRLAFEVTAWASLVLLPAQALTAVIAWFKESLRGVHVGLAALLPEPETPTRLMTGLAVFLDSLGPFSIWSLVVTILGAAALSGAPRKNVAWVLSGFYLVFALLGAVLAAMFVPAR